MPCEQVPRTGLERGDFQRRAHGGFAAGLFTEREAGLSEKVERLGSAEASGGVLLGEAGEGYLCMSGCGFGVRATTWTSGAHGDRSEEIVRDGVQRGTVENGAHHLVRFRVAAEAEEERGAVDRDGGRIGHRLLRPAEGVLGFGKPVRSNEFVRQRHQAARILGGGSFDLRFRLGRRENRDDCDEDAKRGYLWQVASGFPSQRTR